MKKMIVLLGLVGALALSACAAPSINPAANLNPQETTVQPQAQPRLINVNGTGQVMLAPELAQINIGVHSQADNVAQALTDNNEKTQAITDAIKAMKVDEKDIQTSSFNIYPQQQYGPNGEVTGTYYNVDNTVYVTVRDLQSLGELLDKTVRSGANSINGISFDVTPEVRAKAVADARRLAVESAQSQAQALAEAAGVKLGDLQTLNSYNSGSPSPIYGAKGGMMMDSASQVPISAGQINITIDVNAAYSIE